ncbi:MAG TPA: hypothetical protein VNO79_04725 [Actinomycetota bacterium]|nr:hypothetical protein [Actinomycetota bacterium]
MSTLWSLIAASLPGVASLGVPMSTVDLAYHLRAGAVTLREGAPLTRDLFTFTAAGAPWLNQQWGAQVLLRIAFDAWAWAGLAVLRAALISGTYLLLLMGCRERGLRAREAAFLTAGGFVLAAPYLGMRPQLFGVLLFAAVLRILDARGRKPAALWLLPPLAALWSNLHGSFPVGLALIAIAALEDLRDRTRLRRSLVACALSVLGTLANPFGVRVWSYAFGLTTNPVISRAVTEWAPPDARTIPGALFFASLFAFAAWLALKPTRAAWTTVLKAGLLASLGLIAVRGVVWWAIALPVLIAEAQAPAPLAPATSPTSSERSRANLVVMAVLTVVAILFLGRWPGALGSDLVSTAPGGITHALRAALEPGDRVFNAQIWGSWFELALPDNPVFVDSRIELFPEEIWDEYFAVSNGREGWQEILDRWGVQAVAADREQQDGLIPRIHRDPGWRLVYEGRDGLVFVRA